MNPVQRLYNLLMRSRWARLVIGSMAVFFVLNIIVVVMTAGWQVAQNAYYEWTPRSWYFDYAQRQTTTLEGETLIRKPVEFVGVDGKSLVFASFSIIKHSYPIEWNDILRCGAGQEFSFYSVQNTNNRAPMPRTEYRQLQWHYSEQFPYGRRCYLESTITMHVHGHAKVQKVVTDEFVIKKEE